MKRVVLLTAVEPKARVALLRRFPELTVRESNGEAASNEVTLEGPFRIIEELFSCLSDESPASRQSRRPLLGFDTAVFPAKRGFWPTRMVYGVGVSRKRRRQDTLPALSATPAEILHQR